MKITGTTGSLEICVRDHKCEDGDEISVDVEGRTIFSGEIVNDWNCQTIEVRGGETYQVELTALNGTGYKGNCSFIDENTGEIRVTGENTETQVWRHRGGAGSKARLIVETVKLRIPSFPMLDRYYGLGFRVAGWHWPTVLNAIFGTLTSERTRLRPGLASVQVTWPGEKGHSQWSTLGSHGTIRENVS